MVVVVWRLGTGFLALWMGVVRFSVWRNEGGWGHEFGFALIYSVGRFLFCCYCSVH